jgi:hypothetical protein
MVAFTGDTAVVVQPARQPSLADSPATQASIAAYLGSAERMLAVTDLSWKVCAALLVVILVAWTAGVLPGAVRLF